MLEYPDLHISGVTYCNPSGSQVIPHGVNNIIQLGPTKFSMIMPIVHSVPYCTLHPLIWVPLVGQDARTSC